MFLFKVQLKENLAVCTSGEGVTQIYGLVFSHGSPARAESSMYRNVAVTWQVRSAYWSAVAFLHSFTYWTHRHPNQTRKEDVRIHSLPCIRRGEEGATAWSRHTCWTLWLLALFRCIWVGWMGGWTVKGNGCVIRWPVGWWWVGGRTPYLKMLYFFIIKQGFSDQHHNRAFFYFIYILTPPLKSVYVWRVSVFSRVHVNARVF